MKIIFILFIIFSLKGCVLTSNPKENKVSLESKQWESVNKNYLKKGF